MQSWFVVGRKVGVSEIDGRHPSVAKSRSRRVRAATPEILLSLLCCKVDTTHHMSKYVRREDSNSSCRVEDVGEAVLGTTQREETES